MILKKQFFNAAKIIYAIQTFVYAAKTIDHFEQIFRFSLNKQKKKVICRTAKRVIPQDFTEGEKKCFPFIIFFL